MAKNLVVVVMGQNCEKFIGMCLESIKDADIIIYCDGGSTDNTFRILKKSGKIGNLIAAEVIENPYDQDDPKMNGKQRNFYLDYIKKNYSGWWCLAIDADEVVEDMSIVKKFINTIQPEAEDIIFSPKMRHLIGDLGHEDATEQTHFVPHRLFKIQDYLHYPEVEHPVLRGEGARYAQTQAITIWHMSHIAEAFNVKKKVDNHIKKSNIHSPQFLKDWYHAHLFGAYPVKPINVLEIPKVILNNFGVNRDEFYFANKLVLEAKHIMMLKNWVTVTNKKRDEKISIIDFGCGLGHHSKAASFLFDDVRYGGREVSKWAVENTPYKNQDIIEWNIAGDKVNKGQWDLVLCIDILEHLEKDKVEVALKNIKSIGQHYIFSIPFVGDPNLELDATHKTKEEKEWWVKTLSKYFKITDAPKDWIANHQILIGERK